MATALSSYMDSCIYTEEAVAAAKTGDAEGLNNDLRIVRLTCAISDGDIDAARRMIHLLEGESLEGHPLFKLRTAALFVAATDGDQIAFDRAFAQWKAGRDSFPGNWVDDVLDAPELRRCLPVMHATFVKQREIARRALSKQELVFIRDLSFCFTRAVQDNLQWLRASEPNGAIADLIDKYRLVAVDMDLKEAMLDGCGKLPDLIISLDDAGNYRGSFLAH